jgi:hypothetical protein
MSDDALLSTPTQGSQPHSSGWQQGRMDEAQGRTASSPDISSAALWRARRRLKWAWRHAQSVS